jgi:hypothetical protein
MSAIIEVASIIRSRVALLWIVTPEEIRAENGLIEVARRCGLAVRTWDAVQGALGIGGSSPGIARSQDPNRTLTAIGDEQDAAVIWIMRDLPAYLAAPTTRRLLRNLARDLPSKARQQVVVILSASRDVPPDLAPDVTLIEWPLPDRPEIEGLLDATIEAALDGLSAQSEEVAAPKRDRLLASVGNGARERAVDAALGLTLLDASNCFARSLATTGGIDPGLVSQAKREAIGQIAGLTWYDPHPLGLDAVGGCTLLKRWLVEREAGFSAAARAFGITPPRGILLAGLPGTGKSLTAKAVAATWRRPLLRLDLGGLKSKFVGESEGNIRRALAIAERVGGILWLDEIEKALAGSTGQQGDGGVSTDALGAVLTWMQERTGSVFVVATANDVSALPPELTRKGRFDEIFFVDLPCEADRADILRVALAAKGRDADDGDLLEVARATRGFVGAEIAALVDSALFAAFADGQRTLLLSDLLAAVDETTPMSVSSEEKITALRKWSQGRARPAGMPETARERAERFGRRVDL